MPELVRPPRGLVPALAGVVVGDRETSSPAAAAARTSSAGLWVPSDPCEWVCRSMRTPQPSGRGSASPGGRAAAEREVEQLAGRPRSRPAGSSRHEHQHGRGRAQHEPQPSAAASPANTERSKRSSDPTVETSHSGIDLGPIRTRAGGGPSPTSRPGSVRGCRRNASRGRYRAPRRSRTRRRDRRARSCPRTHVDAVTRPALPTTPKSVTDQPGPIGHGR